MSSRTRILTEGFEEALSWWIHDNFKFGTPELKNTQVKRGRNLFVQDMPEVEDIQKTETDYDINREPTVSIYTDPIVGVVPSSGAGGRMEWNLRIILRFGVVPELAKGLLEQLYEEVLRKARTISVGRFIVKGANSSLRPTVFQRVGDQHAFVTCTIKFFVVVRP